MKARTRRQLFWVAKWSAVGLLTGALEMVRTKVHNA